MDKDSGKFFKDSFKGFNKEDVINFIDKLNKEHIETEETLKAQINELKNQLHDANQRNKECEIIIDELNSQTTEPPKYDIDTDEKYIALKNENERLVNEIEELKYVNTKDGKSIQDLIAHSLNDLTPQDNSETEKLTKVIQDKDGEIQLLNAQILKLEEKIKDHQISINITGDLKEDKLYEKIAANLGKVIYFAEKEAEMTIAKAKLEAATLIYNANQEKIEVIEKYERMIAGMAENYQKMIERFNLLKNKIQNACELYGSEIVQIEAAIKDNEQI